VIAADGSPFGGSAAGKCNSLDSLRSLGMTEKTALNRDDRGHIARWWWRSPWLRWAWEVLDVQSSGYIATSMIDRDRCDRCDRARSRVRRV